MSTDEKPKEVEDKSQEKSKNQKPKSINNIPNLTTIQQAETVIIDLDSPRFKQAMDNLHYTKEDFAKKRTFKENADDDKDVIKLRKKHYYSRMLNVINECLDERRRIKVGRVRANPRSASPTKETQKPLSMYKTYFKSQKSINITSPKDKAKIRVERTLQDEEEYQYKLALLEMKQKEKADKKHKMLTVMTAFRKTKNNQRLAQSKNKLDEIQRQTSHELQNYAEELKHKDLQQKEFERQMRLKKEELKRKEEDYYIKRDEIFGKIREIDQQHIQHGQEILEKIEDKFNRSQEIKLKQIKKKVTDVHNKNYQSQCRLENYHKLEEDRQKERQRKLLEQRLKMEKKIADHQKELAKYQEKIRTVSYFDSPHFIRIP